MFGYVQVVLTLLPTLAWGGDVLLKWALGLSPRSAGADLSFGAFSASAVLLIIRLGMPASASSFYVFTIVVLGLLWLVNLVFATVADADLHKSSSAIAWLALYIWPDYAMRFSILLGLVCSFWIATLTLLS